MGAIVESGPLDAVIIGAGFSGLYQLHRLRDDLGLKAVVLEQGDGVGGTWYWNRYPGARCDSESQGYAYFFSRELHEAWQWSERYPGHEEICRYLNFVADRLDLKKDIRFGTRVTACRYLEDQNLWEVRTEGGGTLQARWLVTAVGCLSSANVPKIPGLESFEGDWYHTGQWPHDGVDFTGKRGRADRDRLDRHPGCPGDRRDGGAPDGVPAHRQFLGARPQCAVGRGIQGLGP